MTMNAEEQARLDAIRAREKAATPGPWTPNVESDPPHCGDFYVTVPVQRHATVFLDDTPGPNTEGFEWTANACDERARADILFIAASRADVQWLLALVDAQGEEIAKLVSAYGSCDCWGCAQKMAGGYPCNGVRSVLLQRAEAAEKALAEEREAHAKLNATEKWSDESPLPEDEAIDDAFPTCSGRHDLYAEASRLVSARRSKGSLVALVNWLLHRIEKAVARAAELRGLIHSDMLASMQHCETCEMAFQTPEDATVRCPRCEWRKADERIADLQALVDAARSFVIDGVWIHSGGQGWTVRVGDLAPTHFVDTRDAAIALARELTAKEPNDV